MAPGSLRGGGGGWALLLSGWEDFLPSQIPLWLLRRSSLESLMWLPGSPETKGAVRRISGWKSRQVGVSGLFPRAWAPSLGQALYNHTGLEAKSVPKAMPACKSYAFYEPPPPATVAGMAVPTPTSRGRGVCLWPSKSIGGRARPELTKKVTILKRGTFPLFLIPLPPPPFFFWWEKVKAGGLFSSVGLELWNNVPKKP